MKASISDEACAFGDVERLLDLGRAARVRLLAEHVLARVQRPHRPLVVERVRAARRRPRRPRIGEELVVRAVRPANPCSRAYASARARSRLPTATTSTRGVVAAARRIWSLILPVERSPSRSTDLGADRRLRLGIEEVQPPDVDRHVDPVTHPNARARLERRAERRALARNERRPPPSRLPSPRRSTRSSPAPRRP